ncbi:hypothetical protein [Achromobacter ruhlandii]|uniref:hypothetical protein n=1 Tax=Achromobacter ruhlandii TaxID=72557 RepID=UPI003BA0C7C0
MTQQDDITQPVLTEPGIQALWDEACKDSPKNPGWNRHIRFARAIEQALSKLRAPVANSTLPLEKALHELVSKIAPGLDTGDLLQDAQRASAMLDAIQASAPVADERQDDIAAGLQDSAYCAGLQRGFVLGNHNDNDGLRRALEFPLYCLPVIGLTRAGSVFITRFQKSILLMFQFLLMCQGCVFVVASHAHSFAAYLVPLSFAIRCSSYLSRVGRRTQVAPRKTAPKRIVRPWILRKVRRRIIGHLGLWQQQDERRFQPLAPSGLVGRKCPYPVVPQGPVEAPARRRSSGY